MLETMQLDVLHARRGGLDFLGKTCVVVALLDCGTSCVGAELVVHARELIQTDKVPLPPLHTPTQVIIQTYVDPPHNELVPLDISASSSRGQPPLLIHPIHLVTGSLINKAASMFSARLGTGPI